MDLDRMDAAPRDDQEVVVPQSGHRIRPHNMVDGGHLETLPNRDHIQRRMQQCADLEGSQVEDSQEEVDHLELTQELILEQVQRRNRMEEEDTKSTDLHMHQVAEAHRIPMVVW